MPFLVYSSDCARAFNFLCGGPKTGVLHYSLAARMRGGRSSNYTLLCPWAKMAVKTSGLEPYKLTGVRVTDRELRRGSYATVLELEYMGLKCAGVKIHDKELALKQSDTALRFEEGCRLLGRVRHPNIVQFLGVHFQLEVARAPILVMEFLPTNLTSCIDQHGIFPKEISYSILHDLALGLCYLHSQTPPIIHRDLSSNNVLLTSNMTAKISDLGVARILKLTPLQVSQMTQTPGSAVYMPPEVMKASPIYNTSVDVFSYGILMIHTLSGQWPEPQVGPVRSNFPRKPVPVSEAERRDLFLRTIGKDHPLISLIRKCIDNQPRLRPHMSEIVKKLGVLVLRFPSSLSSQLEMLKRIEDFEPEKRKLRLPLHQEKKCAARHVGEKIQSIEGSDRVIPEKKKPPIRVRESLTTKQQVSPVHAIPSAHVIMLMPSTPIKCPYCWYIHWIDFSQCMK